MVSALEAHERCFLLATMESEYTVGYRNDYMSNSNQLKKKSSSTRPPLSNFTNHY